jgi:hypothetical protein
VRASRFEDVPELRYCDRRLHLMRASRRGSPPSKRGESTLTRFAPVPHASCLAQVKLIRDFVGGRPDVLTAPSDHRGPVLLLVTFAARGGSVMPCSFRAMWWHSGKQGATSGPVTPIDSVRGMAGSHSISCSPTHCARLSQKFVDLTVDTSAVHQFFSSLVVLDQATHVCYN